MLTRNCAENLVKGGLFKEGDFNVRVTIYDTARLSTTHPERLKSAWIEVICDSIGGGIVNSTDVCDLCIENANGNIVCKGTTRGKSIAEIIALNFKKPESLRITIKHRNSSQCRTWIIVTA